MAENLVAQPSATPTREAQSDNPQTATAAVEKPAETNGAPKAEGTATAPEADAANATDAPALDDAAEDPSAADGSNKKNSKRKSSSGVPEHKSKKLNRKKSIVLQLDAEPGQHFWARLKGFPPWPSIICDDEMLPETLLQNRPVTAKRPDGSYREDFLEGGKNVRDRTYPVMYLGTYEFSWANNTEISPLTAEEVKISEGKGKKLTKALQAAYTEAAEQNSIDHYKSKLAQFVVEKEQAEEAAAEAEAAKVKAAEEKQAKKEQQKSKRKSKDARDEDSIMEDADDTATPKDKKSSKKRRKEADSDEEKPVKTPKTIKLSSAAKTPNGDSASKPKSKAKQASASKPAKAEAPISEAEKKEKLKQEILYFRHKLQKGLLPRDAPPKEAEMAQMAVYFDNLEKYPNLEASIILSTRIHKVLKGILKLGSIPLDHEFNFKDRSMKLLKEWNKTLGENGAAPSESKADDENAKSGADVDKADKLDGGPVESDEPADKAGKPKDEPPTSDATGQAEDAVMPDAPTVEAKPEESVVPTIETAAPEASVTEKTSDAASAAA